MIVQIDILCVAQHSINCTYYAGYICPFKLHSGILHLPFVGKKTSKQATFRSHFTTFSNMSFSAY